MKKLDVSNLSAHVVVDRMDRIRVIEKTVGWGVPVYEAPDEKGRDATAILTSTGVLAIVAPNGMIISVWIAGIKQAVAVFRRATGQEKMPAWLWATINYNNNTEAWKAMAA